MPKLLKEAVVHVRFAGRSLDVPLAELGVRAEADDAVLKLALAEHLRVHENQLRDHVIDRHPTGNLTLRPEAVFG